MTRLGGPAEAREVPAQLRIRLNRSSGRPRSMGMSKIHDSDLGSCTSVATAIRPHQSTRTVPGPMGTVLLDVSDARGPRLRGWSRYVDRLARALGDAVVPVAPRDGGRGPEVLWEQVGLPRAAARRNAALIHAPNCFLPLRRPCPGVVTVHDLAFEVFPDDFAPRTRVKYRQLVPRAVRSAER